MDYQIFLIWFVLLVLTSNHFSDIQPSFWLNHFFRHYPLFTSGRQTLLHKIVNVNEAILSKTDDCRINVFLKIQKILAYLRDLLNTSVLQKGWYPFNDLYIVYTQFFIINLIWLSICLILVYFNFNYIFWKVYAFIISAYCHITFNICFSKNCFNIETKMIKSNLIPINMFVN